MVYPEKDKIKEYIDFYFEVPEGLFWLMMDKKVH